MLQLVRQHAADLDLDLLDVAHEEADLAVAGQRQQRAFPEERQRARIRVDLDRPDERLAGNVSARALDAVLHQHIQITADRRPELEAV